MSHCASLPESQILKTGVGLEITEYGSSVCTVNNFIMTFSDKNIYSIY